MKAPAIYREVGEEYRLPRNRRPGHGAPRSPHYDVLAEGKTVFFPLNGVTTHRAMNRIRGAMRVRKLKVTQYVTEIDGTAGIIAWVIGPTEPER